MQIEVLFTPADFNALEHRDLSAACCVVFDVLRATSSMVTALANGAKAILPVQDIPEALRARAAKVDVVLAGERHGLRIGPELTGGIAFDLGNSPREFAPDVVKGRVIAMTTTNGTRALRACAHAKTVFAASFLNLQATAGAVLKLSPAKLVVICSGTFEEAAYEDVLGAGALCDQVTVAGRAESLADSALIARTLYLRSREQLLDALSISRNGKRLLSVPELQEDVMFCAQVDRFHVVAEMQRDGLVTPK